MILQLEQLISAEVVSLGSFCSTIELHPHIKDLVAATAARAAFDGTAIRMRHRERSMSESLVPQPAASAKR